MPARTITYPESLYFDALLAATNSANCCIYIAMFLFKSSYVGETRARQILKAAMKLAAGRGAQVCGQGDANLDMVISNDYTCVRR